MNWPFHLPASCPPNDATCRKITVYRFLLREQEISPSNFRTKKEENPSKVFKKKEQECEACGLSVLVDKEEILRIQRRVPRYRKKIAVANLTEGTGKVKHTPTAEMSSHYTWWIPRDVKPWELVKEVLEPPKIS